MKSLRTPSLRGFLRAQPVCGIFLLLLTSQGPAQAWVNGQNACWVLGEPDFALHPPETGADGVGQPNGVAYDTTSQFLFVTDVLDHRVMVFNLAGGPTNNMAASWVIGQPDLTTVNVCGPPGCAPNSSTLYRPEAIIYDAANKVMFIADTGNQRVLIWDLTNPLVQPPSASMRAADYVLGQSTFTTRAPPTIDQSHLGSPSGLAWNWASRQLFVVDRTFSRVLVYDIPANLVALGSVLPVPASAIIGQSGPSGHLQGLSDHELDFPTNVDVDPTTGLLYVSDKDNNRTMVFETTQTATNGGLKAYPYSLPATWVLGQPDFTTKTAVASPQGLTQPFGGFVDSSFSDYWQADQYRVLLYDISSGPSTDPSAWLVLGQPDFVSQNWPVSQSVMAHPNKPLYDVGKGWLFVPDPNANRLLIFDRANSCGNPVCNNTPGEICGKVTAAENGTALANAVVELHDGLGGFKNSVKTDAAGSFSFGPAGLVINQNYYVTAALSRTESVNPSAVPVAPLTNTGMVTNLQIRGWPGSFQVSGTPGSFVLLSTASYSGVNAPPIAPSSLASSGNYPGVVGSDGKAAIVAPTGSYYLTCWVASDSNGLLTFARQPNTASQGPFSLQPNAVVSGISCEP